MWEQLKNWDQPEGEKTEGVEIIAAFMCLKDFQGEKFI